MKIRIIKFSNENTVDKIAGSEGNGAIRVMVSWYV